MSYSIFIYLGLFFVTVRVMIASELDKSPAQVVGLFCVAIAAVLALDLHFERAFYWNNLATIIIGLDTVRCWRNRRAK